MNGDLMHEQKHFKVTLLISLQFFSPLLKLNYDASSLNKKAIEISKHDVFTKLNPNSYV